ncbi:MAG: 4Fe-4S binding protein [Chloroflexi bacterium]|nr:4Fe-4S binding protein [Chloroflexota bacterium]
MYGQGILKGLWVTFRHFVNTYVDDIRYAGRKYLRQENFAIRQGLKAQGAFTVQYPDEKLAVPERFRFTPFLVVNDPDHPEAPGDDWCTSCGICAKVCPPQCIWIVRGSDPTTGRPVPQPEAFFIDIDICMNCGFCAEFCPFDAIKMDHNYELASYDRTSHHIHDKQYLSRPLSYWKTIAPTTALEEAVARGGWEHPDVLKAMKKAGQTAVTPTWDNMFTKPEPAAKPLPPAESADEDPAKAERLRKREEALARKRAAEAGEPAQPAAAAVEASAPAPAAPTADKPKFDKQAMLEKIRQRKADKG